MDEYFRRMYIRVMLVVVIALPLMAQFIYLFAWTYRSLKDPAPPSLLTFAENLLLPTFVICWALAALARWRGRSRCWGFMGLLSFIGVIIVLSLPPRSPRPPGHRAAATRSSIAP